MTFADRIVLALRNSPGMSTDELLTELSRGLKEPVTEGTLQVTICNMRKSGIKIITERTYRMMKR